MFSQSVLEGFTQIFRFQAFSKYSNALSFKIYQLVCGRAFWKMSHLCIILYFYRYDLLWWSTLMCMQVRQEHMLGTWQRKQQHSGPFLPSTVAFSLIGIRFSLSSQNKHNYSLRLLIFYFHIDQCLPECMCAECARFVPVGPEGGVRAPDPKRRVVNHHRGPGKLMQAFSKRNKWS